MNNRARRYTFGNRGFKDNEMYLLLSHHLVLHNSVVTSVTGSMHHARVKTVCTGEAIACRLFSNTPISHTVDRVHIIMNTFMHRTKCPNKITIDSLAFITEDFAPFTQHTSSKQQSLLSTRRPFPVVTVDFERLMMCSPSNRNVQVMSRQLSSSLHSARLAVT